MTYYLCNRGQQFIVGMEGSPEEVSSEANLAHNIFNVNFNDDIFSGRINFHSSYQFMKFLIYKEWLVNGQCLRSAAKVARRVLTEQTRRINNISSNHCENNYYTVSTIGR